MPTYVMHRRGGTTGAETGTSYRFGEGDEIDAPKGEFRHLPEAAYQTRPMRPTEPDAQPSQSEDNEDGAVWTVGAHTGGGWYKLLYGGEEVETEHGPLTSGPGRDEAQAEADDLNDRGVTPAEYSFND